jgi:hypothetical protein
VRVLSARPIVILERTDIQRLLDAGRSAWIPREAEPWEEFVRRKAPARPAWWQLRNAAHYQRSLARALEKGKRTTATTALLVPLWIGNNEDEVPREDEWRRKLVLFVDDEPVMEVDAEGAAADLWARLEVDLVRGAFLTLARHYAPDVPRVERFGPYAVTEGLVRAVVTSVTAGGPIRVRPTPGTIVPAFSMLVETAADATALPRDVSEATVALAQRMQFVTKEQD